MTNRASLAVLVFSLASLACASVKKAEAPKWVQRGSGIFLEGGEPALFGVGADDAAARAELARVTEGLVPVFTEAFMAASQAKGDERVDEEQHMGQTIKNLLKFTKNFAVIAGHWDDPAGGTPRSLGKVDVNAVMLMIEDSQELDPKALNFVKAHAREIFAARAAP